MVPVLERGQTGDVIVFDVVALGAKPGYGGVQTVGVSQDHGVADQAESGELVLSEPAQLTRQLCPPPVSATESTWWRSRRACAALEHRGGGRPGAYPSAEPRPPLRHGEPAGVP